jgi:alkylhydroperoxidase/carboxymuconolactone decarboxylase family protein YurZ
VAKVPGWYLEQRRRHPEVIKAYERLGEACRQAGPLDGRTAALVKLAIAIGSRQEGAVHSHVRRSIEAGATIDECRHVVLLATTTIGFPAMMAALSCRRRGEAEAARGRSADDSGLAQPAVEPAGQSHATACCCAASAQWFSSGK